MTQLSDSYFVQCMPSSAEVQATRECLQQHGNEKNHVLDGPIRPLRMIAFEDL